MNDGVFGINAAALIAILSIASPSLAQEPGTNVATAPPTQSTGAVSPSEPTQLPTSTSNSPEPVIDAQSTSSSVPNRPLLITGAVLLGGSYGASAIVAATSNRTADDRLYYPVAGPWMDLHQRNCSLDACSAKTLDQVLLVGDGIVQGIGALTIVMSLFVPERTTRHWYLIGNDHFTVAPQIGSALTGLTATGKF